MPELLLPPGVRFAQGLTSASSYPGLEVGEKLDVLAGQQAVALVLQRPINAPGKSVDEAAQVVNCKWEEEGIPLERNSLRNFMGEQTWDDGGGCRRREEEMEREGEKWALKFRRGGEAEGREFHPWPNEPAQHLLARSVVRKRDEEEEAKKWADLISDVVPMYSRFQYCTRSIPSTVQYSTYHYYSSIVGVLF